MEFREVRPGLYERLDTPHHVKLDRAFVERVAKEANSPLLLAILEEAIEGDKAPRGPIAPDVARLRKTTTPRVLQCYHDARAASRPCKRRDAIGRWGIRRRIRPDKKRPPASVFGRHW